MARRVRDVIERLNVQRFVLYGQQPSPSTIRAFVRAGYALNYILPPSCVRTNDLAVSPAAPLPHSVEAALHAATPLDPSTLTLDSVWRSLLPAPAAVPASCALLIAVDTGSDLNSDAAWGHTASITRVAYRCGAHIMCVGDAASGRLRHAFTTAICVEGDVDRVEGEVHSSSDTTPDVQAFDMTWPAFLHAALGEEGSLKFGPHDIHRSQVCYANEHVLVLTNLKPVLPGHLLCITRRRAPRFAQLTSDEVSCLWLTAQRVGDILSRATHAHGLTIAVQDGAAAGQTVPHVHVHILPRRSGDIPHNDAVYDMIDDSERAQGGGVSTHGGSTHSAGIALDPLPHPRASSTSVHDAAAGTPLALGDTLPPSGVETAQLHAVVRATSHAVHPHVVASSERPSAGGDDRKPRSVEDMAREAAQYRPLMRDDLSQAWIDL